MNKTDLSTGMRDGTATLEVNIFNSLNARTKTRTRRRITYTNDNSFCSLLFHLSTQTAWWTVQDDVLRTPTTSLNFVSVISPDIPGWTVQDNVLSTPTTTLNFIFSIYLPSLCEVDCNLNTIWNILKLGVIYKNDNSVVLTSHLDLHCLHKYLFWSARLKWLILCVGGRVVRPPAETSKGWALLPLAFGRQVPRRHMTLMQRY